MSERSEDDIEEVERLVEKVDSLEVQLQNVIDERDEAEATAEEAASFREQVRDALGLHWDASEAQMILRIRAQQPR